MKAGEKIYTPRFCTVNIEKVFESKTNAYEEGYTEPTHYHSNGYTILGKSLDMYHMEFAGVKE